MAEGTSEVASLAWTLIIRGTLAATIKERKAGWAPPNRGPSRDSLTPSVETAFGETDAAEVVSRGHSALGQDQAIWELSTNSPFFLHWLMSLKNLMIIPMVIVLW